MAGGTDFGPQSPVSGAVAFCMAGNERGELAGTLPASSWKSAMLLQLLFSPKLTDRCEKSKGFNTEAPVGQDGIERWVMPLAICIFRQQLLQRTIQRCRHWPCGTAVLRVKAARIHMQTNHKRTDSFAAWVFKNIYTRLYLFYLEFQDLLIAHSSIQGNPAPRIQALAYSAEGWLREHGRTAVRSCTGCRKTQPNPQIQACSRRTACKSCCRKME